MNALTEIQQQSPSNASSALMLELAKCLKLVAPITMSADAQLVWLQAAVDALEGIQASEVQAISLELRRSVTRPSQIVPEISRLVAEKRNRMSRTAEPINPLAGKEREITEAAQLRRGKARTQVEVEEIWRSERSARADAGIAVQPIQRPLSQRELETMPAHILKMGLNSGFLKRDGDRVAEVMDARETDEIRAANR